MRKMTYYPGDDGSDHDVELSVKQILLTALAGMVRGTACLVLLCADYVKEGAGRVMESLSLAEKMKLDRFRRLLAADPMGVHVHADDRAAAERLVELGEAEWLRIDPQLQNPHSVGVIAPKLAD